MRAPRSPQAPGPGSRRWAARRSARRCRPSRPGSGVPISAATMSSKSGSSGSTTKSSAPVMSTVRCPSASVLAHAADGGGERLGEDQLAEQLGGVLVDLVDRGAFVAAVEEAQEVAAVLAVERQQRRSFGQRLEHEAQALVAAAAAGWRATRRTPPRWRRSACSRGRTPPAGARGRAPARAGARVAGGRPDAPGVVLAPEPAARPRAGGSRT